ncbi:MAG TPA: arylesterase [Pseudolabrys sp.]|jgi:acyl-CoA thioesterase-1
MGLHGVALAQTAPVKIVAFGDSLTAGYGLPGPDAFPAKLAAALKAKGENVEIANAGVSGDTTTGGLERVDWSVPDGTDAVILALGANDLLRGIDPAVTEKALDGILAKLTARKIKVLLAGMLAGKNMGADYETRYNAIFPALAKKYDVLFYPFFLDGVATDRALNQQDGIHPNAAGVDAIVKRILPKVEDLIAQVRANPARAQKS